MLESVLHELVPGKLAKFAKLDHGEPYLFEAWRNDRSGSPCMYYWILGDAGRNKKRIPVSEIYAALTELRDTKVFDRALFRKVCPISASVGSCGFAVLGRILEALGVACYDGKSEFKLTDADHLTNLLRSK